MEKRNYQNMDSHNRIYHQRFHQESMSRLLIIFKKSKNIMLVMVASRLLIEQNVWAALFIFLGYMAMIACTSKLEKFSTSTNRSVLIMTH